MTKPAELILHIGHFKTGTTALQICFASNAAKLEEQGVFYSPIPMHLSKHSALAFCLLHDAGVTELMHGYKPLQSTPEIWGNLFDTVRLLDSGQSLLVSSEELIRVGGYPQAAEGLRTVIADNPDIPVRVIAYLRAPNSHLHSWHNQLVKMGVSTGNFDTTVRTGMERVHWDAASALRPWVEVFGAENVILRQFHDTLRDGDALLVDFMTALGFDALTNPTLPKQDPNPRLDDRISDLKRAYLRAGLPKPMTDKTVALAAANLTEEMGDDAAGESFVTIRATALAGITELAGLPNAGLDVPSMTADLPTPLSDDARALSELVVLLGGEIAQLRTVLRETNRRMNRLENKLNPTAQDAVQDSGDDA